MTGSLEVQLSNALHQRDVARRERDDAESRLALKQRAADEAVDRALELARQLAEARAELERAKPVLAAARERAQVLHDLQVHGSGSVGWMNRDRASDRSLVAVNALDACPSCGPGGCAGHTKAVTADA